MDRIIGIAEWFKRRFLPIHHDASYHPSEAYYGSIYLEIIQDQLRNLSEKPLRLLEIGCGTGRLLVPLAKAGHTITGIDWHRDSLRLARENAQKAGVQPELIDGDLSDHLSHFPAGTFDAILAIEVLYNNREFMDIIAQLQRVLRDGGLLFISHRTRYYYLMQCLAYGKLEDAYQVATNSEGRLPKGHHRIYYNWQTSAEIDRLFGGAGMKVICKHPIGPYSGFFPDPLGAICDPGKLSEKERLLLREIEMNYDAETMMAARYVLVAAQKRLVGPVQHVS